MPTISSFYGILIRMYFNEHDPPHFHAIYGDFQATIDIARLELIEGELPRRARELVLEWARIHQAELVENWSRCRHHETPWKIEPLT